MADTHIFVSTSLTAGMLGLLYALARLHAAKHVMAWRQAAARWFRVRVFTYRLEPDE